MKTILWCCLYARRAVPFQILCNSGHLTFVPLRDIPKTVEHLSITKNNMTYLPTDAFTGLRNLRKLTLDFNGIRRVDRFAFRGLARLRELSIQHTPLESLDKFSFAGLQNVTAILLGYNQIKVIHEFAFAGTANIRLILLNNNPLHTVRPYTGPPVDNKFNCRLIRINRTYLIIICNCRDVDEYLVYWRDKLEFHILAGWIKYERYTNKIYVFTF